MATEELRKMAESVQRIERALLGDEQFGHKGLVEEHKEHARRIRRLELWVFRIAATEAGAAFVIGVIYRVFVDFGPLK
jgi:hypothetical protein